MDKELKGKAYKLPKEFSMNQDSEFPLARDITFSELLELVQEYYNTMTGNLWTHQDGEWSLKKLLELSAVVLANFDKLLYFDGNADFQNVDNELATGFS